MKTCRRISSAIDRVPDPLKISIQYWYSFCKVSKSHSSYPSYETLWSSRFTIHFYARDGFHLKQPGTSDKSADYYCIYSILRAISLVFLFIMRAYISLTYFKKGISLWRHFILFRVSLFLDFTLVCFIFSGSSFSVLEVSSNVMQYEFTLLYQFGICLFFGFSFPNSKNYTLQIRSIVFLSSFTILLQAHF